MELDGDAQTILIISLVLICLLLILSTITLWFVARKRLATLMRRNRVATDPQSSNSRRHEHRRSTGFDVEGAVGGSPSIVATRPIEGPPPPYEQVCLEYNIREKR
ncbi:uncharacterized protein LOC124162648 [Ischnura elegans]|uniref:uncharacterized protein LOC124162648 n=1 Tax=Ischnura elegans TaxID=197161 RepID=UPI001ED866B1|nr:uncharacterized protein LOC124162648 [Ischnura elegans]